MGTERKRRNVAEGLGYAIGLAEALREVHGRDRVYGFLEPRGIALIEGQVRLVPRGPTALSPYFSPEQVVGNDLDLRSDIFSLGAVMYEMLSGRRSFGSVSKAGLRGQILDSEFAPLENVPPALARLVERCLEKKPERRIQRIEILLAELKLQAILAGGARAGGELRAVSITAGMRMEPRSPKLGAVVSPAATSDLATVCPMCGTHDVHSSQPVGFLESVFIRLGMRINKCYRCYHRFLEVAGLSFKRPA